MGGVTCAPAPPIVVLKEKEEVYALLNGKDGGGLTPVHLAAFNGDVEILKFLGERESPRFLKRRPTTGALQYIVLRGGVTWRR